MEESIELSPDGNSLIKAVYHRRLRLTRLLLEGGAYINESNDRGETPLMVACKTNHVDHQSVSKVKMVKYLLENKADPNIQDKTGKTALMHACVQKAGPEIISLLLKSGADVSLQDHSGNSVLVYSVNSEDKETLKVLLDACKAKGKEVIIITKDRSPSGKQRTRQYLNVPPLDSDESQSLDSCTSPSDVEVKTSPSLSTNTSQKENALFSFKENNYPGRKEDSPEPQSPSRKTHNGPQTQHAFSEPWMKSNSSIVGQNQIRSLQEELQDITPEEELYLKINSLALSKRFITRHHSIDIKDTLNFLKNLEQTSSRKMSSDEIGSHLISGEINRSEIPVEQNSDSAQTSFVSTLKSIVHRRNLGANHYSSDSQLTTSLSPLTEDSKMLLGKKKLLSQTPSLSSSSRELIENMPPTFLSRRNHAILERRGSDHTTLSRPGFLPPLNVNPHPPFSDIHKINSFSCGQKTLIPTAPAYPKDFKTKTLLTRRQSLQTEQIKQLVNF
ncbi:ankyrin repeat domain-containing protein 34B [Anolis carolinensis]|nr:PREDICTED: ankyrin repeat domain-containing protein 34B-like [Anolis carolinensis]XP_016854557.1 PREDICTED: ankyrin repeat domain-containing protein 34B-like [Anolis carolinensis]|eukprot:XP_003230723.1 PREDICTED: ankyrin repeat domain-containing protein 34B-like [Anolis carolinensis]